jgi:hypothetical protein
MKDFFQTLQDAFPVLKNHPILMARLLLTALVLGAGWAAKGWRKKVFGPPCSKMYGRVALTNRWLFVYRNDGVVNSWKYYTSHVSGKGDTGDDIIWSLVSWPSLKPIDSFTLVGAVGMDHALHESTVKLEGRWKIIHYPDTTIGPVPARGLTSMARRVCARALLTLSGGPDYSNKIEPSTSFVTEKYGDRRD